MNFLDGSCDFPQVIFFYDFEEKEVVNTKSLILQTTPIQIQGMAVVLISVW